jgi:hypothetical protein
MDKLLSVGHRLRTAGVYSDLKEYQVIENRPTILVHWTILDVICRVFQTPFQMKWGCGMILDAIRNKQVQRESVIAQDIAEASARTMDSLCLCVKVKLTLAVLFKSEIEGCPHPCQEKMQLIRKILETFLDYSMYRTRVLECGQAHCINDMQENTPEEFQKTVIFLLGVMQGAHDILLRSIAWSHRLLTLKV